MSMVVKGLEGAMEIEPNISYRFCNAMVHSPVNIIAVDSEPPQASVFEKEDQKREVTAGFWRASEKEDRKHEVTAGFWRATLAVPLRASKTEQFVDCSSSCGNLLNISYPFRFKGDQPNYGNPEYELSCEGGRP
ncbi:hypothetical protein ACLOJK_002833 [Asimina triloba]